MGGLGDQPSTLVRMAIDVTDATFQADVIDKSSIVPVVVDLWAPWCGPCRTLGPIIEKAIDATEGKVVLAKVNIDENPQISAQFRVQSIPAVYALRNGQIVDGFLGALPERDVERFVETLLPTEEQTTLAALIEAGDEISLRKAIQLDPGNEDAVVALAEVLVSQKQFDEALALLERIPESERTRPIAAAARLGEPQTDAPSDEYDGKLAALLPRVKDDDEARQQYVDILELMGIDDPRTAEYRKRLSRELF